MKDINLNRLEPYLTECGELAYLQEDVKKLFEKLCVRIEVVYEQLNELELHKIEENMKTLYDLKTDICSN